MNIDGWTITAVVVFFVVSAGVLYRWLMSVCSKLSEYQRGCKEVASREGR
jgi:hypothetical protein